MPASFTDAGKELFLKALEPVLNRITNADIVFMDPYGIEMLTVHIPRCRPGQEITQKVPSIDDIAVI
jgi:hypothetical protein